MAIPLRKSPLCLAPAKAGFALAGLIPLVLALPAGAVEFSFVDGEVTGSLDTTLSYGQLYRVQGQDKTNDDTNGNDGNRNFDTGLVSEVFKITSDLEANYQNYGLFVRGTAFYDTQIMDKRNDNDDYRPSQSYPNNPYFTDETRESAGTNAEILDAYVYGNWDVGSMPLTVKVGRQVFNWGEGLFYRGGVNTTNPLDAAKFRLPGSELKEVLVPVEALFATPRHPYTQGLIRSIPRIDRANEKKRLEAIAGTVPSLLDPPPGCRFAQRCKFATEACTREMPPLKEAAPGHFVRCIL